ncbi:MAG: CRISPR-associated helicase Cas3' [Acidobacteria bacterium]|nr:CRISPR-associated helicase Cas3' [Acidobacteriota bacterium]
MVGSYSRDFAEITGRAPYPYQLRLAEAVFSGLHSVVRAPTGAGKTLAVLIPFLLGRQRGGRRKLIYVLPLLTLVEAVFAEAAELARPLGLSVAMQTGERPDAEFFHGADIIVTTFDQLLSGLLCEPFGLAPKLWNINAAAMAGKLVVFDEFHLMGPSEAFATAVFGASLFKDYCTTVWMTATATSPLTERLGLELGAVEIVLSDEELSLLFEGRGIRRILRLHLDRTISADDVLAEKGRVLVVMNTVGQAQQLFREVLAAGRSPLLLHARFFADDRQKKQAELKDAALVIATQVIEAGVNISAESVLTELAPVNSVVQRAGRCARFAGETGTVHVFKPRSRMPYEETDLRKAAGCLSDTDAVSPAQCAEWVQAAHADQDRLALAGWTSLLDRRRDLIAGHVTGEGPCGAAAFIRNREDSVRLYLLANSREVQPQDRQSLTIYRSALRRFAATLECYDGENWAAGDPATAYAVCLPLSVARYTSEAGLELGQEGSIESPPKLRREKPGYPAIKGEPWWTHTLNVARHCSLRLGEEGLGNELEELARKAGLLHDVGKLTHGWQAWARARYAAKGQRAEGAIAHTDYDRAVDRGVPKPPKHTSASTVFSASLCEEAGETEACAILLAVLGHHGGTLLGVERPDKLDSSASKALALAGLEIPVASPAHSVQDLLRCGIRESFESVWPLAAILSRVLRLADQMATAEVSSE